jgi:SagB-type dehydrogenase family enzyme
VSDALSQVFNYHEATKHHLNRYARGPGGLDWATQPDPFRRYVGASVIHLERLKPGDQPLYEPVFVEAKLPVQPLNHRSISQLFYDSLALSAWKQAGEVRWSLRINPSSGNLHPTEGYLVCGRVEGLCTQPMVCHYAPKEHALERRAEFSEETWKALTAGLPNGAILVGLTSIHWREAWKYGERAFRYCQHDIGHAIGTVALAAAAMGWKSTLLDGLSTESLASLLGVFKPEGAEPEQPECLLAVYPQTESCAVQTLPEDVTATFKALSWQGTPNRLSPAHVDWPMIDQTALATRKPATQKIYETGAPIGKPLEVGSAPISFRKVVHQRRSCLALDGHTGVARDAFYQILQKVIPGPGQFPFNAFPWRPRIHFGLFVHRVQDVDPGLYFLARDPAKLGPLKDTMKKEFAWEKPLACPDRLELYRLLTGDARELSQQISCHQEIASHGCFSLGMIAEFEEPLRKYGAWFYPRLFWEAGAIGQVLYLEAEAYGIRGTGIGCFFDDPMHRVLGITGRRFQDLYHFTIGGPVEDKRLTTLPAYPPAQNDVKESGQSEFDLP